MKHKLIEFDGNLAPYQKDLDLRMENYIRKRNELLLPWQTLADFANGHAYFGFHKTPHGWYYREWAPSAYQLYLEGEFNGWNQTSHPLHRIGDGNWEIFLEGENALWDGCKVKTVVDANLTRTEHIPLYARRVVQDPATTAFCCEVVDPANKFEWTDGDFKTDKCLYIYEAHVGMAQEEGKVGSYREFADITLPHVKEAGYNTIQLMAIMEHPYYGSFGYQVSNFFAASSWYGTPDDLKAMIEQHGGRNVGSVSGSIDYLIAGEKMGPEKRRKAEKLGVKIISEAEFMAMVAAAPTEPIKEEKTGVAEAESAPASTNDIPVQGSLF